MLKSLWFFMRSGRKFYRDFVKCIKKFFVVLLLNYN